MKTIVAAAAATALTATAAGAGGVQRTAQSVAPIFEPGNYVEFSFGSINPTVSGAGAGTVPNPAQPSPGVATGKMTKSYWVAGTAFKLAVTDSVDLAFILDQPFGADVSYPVLAPPYFAAGSTATLDSTAMTAIARYKLPSNLSVHGGVRFQTFQASAFVPFVTPVPGTTPPYSATGNSDSGIGYLVGAAYERPDIALRVALTYNSAIEHKLPTTETSALGTTTSTTTIETPQSINLDLQSGVAANTLVFGGVRWVDWSEFEIAPATYRVLTASATQPAGAALVSYDDDTITYTLGVGRKLSDMWSIAGSVAYEAPTGGFASNLGPTDGSTTLSLAAIHTQGNMELTTGVSYTMIGDAMTELGGSGIAASNFTENHAIAFGMKIGFSF